MYSILEALVNEKIEPGNLGHIICTAAYDKFNPKTLMEIIGQIEKAVEEQDAHTFVPRPHIILSLTGSGVQRTIKGLKGGNGIRKVWDKNEGIIISGSYYDTVELDMDHIKKDELMEMDGGGYTLHVGVEGSRNSLCGASALNAIRSYPALEQISDFGHHCLKYCSVCRDLVYNEDS